MSFFDKIFKYEGVMSREDEAQNIRDYQAGDREAGDRLIRAQSRWLMLLCRSLCRGTHHDAEDMFSALSIDFLSAIKTFNLSMGTRLSTVLSRVVYRRGGRWLRRSGNPAGMEADDWNRVAAMIATAEDIDSRDDEYYRDIDEAANVIKSVIGSFNQKARDALELRLSGMGYEEIARVLNLTPAIISKIFKEIAEAVKQDIATTDLDMETLIGRFSGNEVKIKGKAKWNSSD